jgi:GT2 family glycosyltransferase
MSVDISVIIPTCGRPKELIEAVTSALSQPRIEIEVFVVDDSPEGSAREVIESLKDRRVTYIRNPKATGGVPSAVRNIALPLARGALVHFLDDDDLVPEGHYAAVREAFSRHPAVGLVFGRIEPFGCVPEEQMRHERDFFVRAARRAAVGQRFGSKVAFTGLMVFGEVLLVCSAGVVRRECAVCVGGFDSRIRLGEDADFYARVMRQFGAYFMDRVTLRYRISHPSLMHYSLDLNERDARYFREGRLRTRTKYRAEHGILEFYSLKLFTRALLRMA